VRGRATADTMVVRAHAEATLDAFQLAGVRRVGVLPERPVATPRPRSASADAVVVDLDDARKKRAKVRGRAKSKVTLPKVAPDEVFGERVDVVTAGDNDVCQVCIDIADGGPYTIKQARGLIPAHPWCRCAFIPTEDQRFSHEQLDELDQRPRGDEISLDAWDPAKHPRVPKGSAGGGEFGTVASAKKRVKELGREQDALYEQHRKGRLSFKEYRKRAEPLIAESDKLSRVLHPEEFPAFKASRNKDLSSGLTEPEEVAIGAYTADDSRRINNFLRGKSAGNDSTKAIVKDMDSAFAKARLSSDTTAGRSVSRQFHDELEKHVGKSFTDDGFVSTTQNRDSLKFLRPSQKRVEVFLPKGSRAFNVAKYSEVQDMTENEVLVDRGSTFKVRRGKAGLELHLVKQRRR
jgi:hypothetical protein